MKDDSGVKIVSLETRGQNGGPCAGGVAEKQRKYRRLRSLSTNKIIHVQKEPAGVQKTFDPTAWYIAQVRKRWTELKSRDLLNKPEGFTNNTTSEHYQVEAYVATQRKRGAEKIVIHGKVFVRVAEANRVDVLRQCPYLSRFSKDPSLALTAHEFTDFARVPDVQIERLKAILEIADGTVEYSEELRPQVHDQVRLSDGILSRSVVLKDLEGTIEMLNGRKYATVILDKIGSFKFRLPVSEINKYMGRLYEFTLNCLQSV